LRSAPGVEGLARPAALLVALALAGCRAPEGPPNVLFVTVDTLRADHCSLYGYARPTTPRLDGLARDGSVFEHAYAPMATTAPSHSTMFTGLLPRRHGVVKNGLVLDAGQDTLAEAFSRRGYRTAAIVSSFVLERRFGLDQGFASYDDRFERTGGSLERPEDDPSPLGLDQRADRTFEKARAWLKAAGYLDRQKTSAPFFLWVHFFDPHEPYAPPRELRRMFRSDEKRRHAADIAAYDAEVRFTDTQIGALADALEAAGRLDDTLFVVTADHGEGLWDHGESGHGLHVYEEAVRVPLVVRWPAALRRARRLSGPVSLADLRPTLLELTGAIEERPGDGTSLAALLRTGRSGDPNRPIFLERREYEYSRGRPWLKGEMTALRLGRFKYIEAPEENRVELYDLEADAGEKRDIAAQRPKETVALQVALARWRERRGPRATDDASEDTQEALRALGYVQ
jgi:arylsulfatase A-like enzyme